MKSIFLTFFILLSTIVYGHHITPLGYCNDQKAYFKTVSFSANLEVQTQYRVLGSTQWIQGISFFTPSNGSSVIFTVPQQNSNQIVEVRFRYKPSNSGWSSWSNSTKSISSFYAGCSFLPIKFKDVTYKRIDSSTIQLMFESEEDNTINYYRIMVSNDGKNYQERTIVFPDGVQGNKKYIVILKFNTL